MKDNNKELLDDVIEAMLAELSDIEAGSDKRAKAVVDVEKLYKLSIENEKTELEYKDRYDKLIAEDELNRTKVNEGKKDRITRTALEVLAIVVPIGFSAAWMRKGFEFEKDGTYTSSTFKWLTNKFKLTKK